MDIVTLVAGAGGLLMTILAFVVALSIIVAVHEYGHYIVARWCGIHAETFSLGFGPVLAKWHDKRGTQWQIAALPFGGYVKFLGDSGAASGKDAAALEGMSDTERRATLHAAPLWARAATVSAGPVFNFLLSILIFAGIFMASGIARDEPVIAQMRPLPASITNELAPGDRVISVAGIETPDLDALLYTDVGTSPEVTYVVDRDGARLSVTGPNLRVPLVDMVQSGSPAYDAGMRPGDVVVAINGDPIGSFPQLQQLVTGAGSEGGPLTVTVWRDGGTRDFSLTPRMQDIPADDGWEKRALIGISVESFFVSPTDTPGPLRALWLGVRQVWSVISMSVDGLWHMIAGKISSCNLQGPIGIAQTSGAAAAQGLDSFVWLIAVLSTAIGFLNLFPIPVLDGGHLVLYAWEAVRGRPAPPRVQQALMAVGLVIILALMLFAVTNDLFCP